MAVGDFLGGVRDRFAGAGFLSASEGSESRLCCAAKPAFRWQDD